MGYFSDVDARLTGEGLRRGTLEYERRGKELQAQDCLDQWRTDGDEFSQQDTCEDCLKEGAGYANCPWEWLHAVPNDGMPADVEAALDTAERWLDEHREDLELLAADLYEEREVAYAAIYADL